MQTLRSRGMRKIPRFIEHKLATVGSQFNVAVVKRLPLTDIQNGNYLHAGLGWSDKLEITSPTLPKEAGRYTKLNVNGQEIILRDLPKIDKTITFVNPRLFGIPGNRCTITQIREVYQREQLPARKLQIEASVLQLNETDCIARFGVTRQFTPTDESIERELLFALNLLQETVGGVNVFPHSATANEYLGSIQVHWEILASGTRDENIRLILSGFRPKTDAEREELERLADERYDFFESLGCKHIIRGTGGMNGYMGAEIEDDVVVFEHLTPGNGIYVLFEDWETQSQRTKSELLANGIEGKDYVRIIHIGDWRLKVRNAIEDWRGRHFPKAA